MDLFVALTLCSVIDGFVCSFASVFSVPDGFICFFDNVQCLMDLFVALATFSVFDGFVCCFDTVFSVSVGYVYFFHFVFTVHWLDFCCCCWSPLDSLCIVHSLDLFCPFGSVCVYCICWTYLVPLVVGLLHLLCLFCPFGSVFIAFVGHVLSL